MKVLALNASPRKEKSCTNTILTPLLEGMRSAGAEVETLHLARYEIKPCLGCFGCWTKNGGKCVQKDDMEPLLEKYTACDLVVMGTPLYHYTMTGILKNFMDRTLPIAEPWLVPSEENPDLTTHPVRAERPAKVFLVSPCGFPEAEHFEALVHFFKYYAQKLHWEYLGEILRSSGELLRVEAVQPYITWWYDLVRRAGRELIQNGMIADETRAGLAKPLVPSTPAEFRKQANDYWESLGVPGRPANA